MSRVSLAFTWGKLDHRDVRTAAINAAIFASDFTPSSSSPPDTSMPNG